MSHTLTNWDLMKHIRDARAVFGVERELLLSLAMTAYTKRSFSSFPSYARLKRELNRHEKTLRRAAASLEKQGFITRSRRYGQTNVFTINVPKLVELAETSREQDRQQRVSRGTTVVEPAPAAPDRNGWEPSLSQRILYDLDGVIERLRDTWPEHPVWKNPVSDGMRDDILACVDMAGNPSICGWVFLSVWARDKKTYDLVQRSTNFSRYLKQCFPGWLTKYKTLAEETEAIEQEELERYDAEHETSHVESFSADYVDELA